MRILLLSPYDAPSHAYWREGLCRHFAAWDWTCLTLPARFFSWRIRGNSLTWGLEQRPVLERPYDLVIATSMTDLATLRGLVPALSTIPTVLYFHENQFAYPKSAAQHQSVEPQMVACYAALCADTLVFNSEYNRTTFLTGLDQLLRRLPDGVPPSVVTRLQNKSQVLPVPIPLRVAPPPKPAAPVQIVWNHRWEYDKGPDLLLACLERLPESLQLQVHVVGQQFRRVPAEFGRIKEVLQAKGWLGTWGYLAKRADYLSLLDQSHLVLSTAQHDFQGLAVLEAVAAGCIPVVPSRLAYPEWFGPQYCYAGDVEGLCRHLIEAVAQVGRTAIPDLSHLTWAHLGPDYEALVQRHVERGT